MFFPVEGTNQDRLLFLLRFPILWPGVLIAPCETNKVEIRFEPTVSLLSVNSKVTGT